MAPGYPRGTAARWRSLLPPERPPALFRFAKYLLLTGVVVFAASTVLVPTGSSARPFLDGWLYDSLTVLGAIVIAGRAWCVATERLAWGLLAVAIAANAVGDVVSTLFVASNGSFPSIADPFYLTFYPCAYVALVLLFRARATRMAAGVAIDGVACALAMAALAATIAFGPIVAATGGSVAAVAVGLAYPVADLLLLALAVAMLVILGWRSERRVLLLAAAFAIFAAADTVYLYEVAKGSYVQGRFIDAFWPAGTLLTAYASWMPTRRLADRRLDGIGALVAPFGCTAAAAAILVTGTQVKIPDLAVALAAATLLAVTARLAITFRDVIGLAETRTQALTDELTGLANRRSLVAALGAHAAQFRRMDPDAESSLALMLIDLDRFKEINDSLGHDVGDELLRQLARRLERYIRPGDLLSRLGGDEFSILLSPERDQSAAERVASRIATALDEPFALDDLTLHVKGSIGIALYPHHCSDPMQLLQRADVAVTTAKQAPTRIALYQVAEDPHSKERVQLLEALRAGLAHGELVCHYQPKITIATGATDSVEALVRWQHPDRGLLAPDTFLPLAEHAGLMRPLTLAVLDIALRDASRWRQDGRPVSVAVNLSVTNLLDVELASDVAALLYQHQLPASALILEITETVLMTDSTRAKSVVDALHALGVGLSVDDYGTGYSSLAYLQDLAIDELKLDRSFIMRLGEDPRTAAIVRSTVELAHSLGLRIVAEGVEDAGTVEMLHRYGCDVIQGYFYSRPVPAEQLAGWLANGPAAAPARRLSSRARPG
jgi:diguanylate cyclase (GGDEF)-like protein